MVGLADMSSVSRENIEVMDALIGNFTLYDDVNKVYDILKGHRKLSLLCEEKRAGAKESVKQLQKQVVLKIRMVAVLLSVVIVLQRR